MDLKVQDLQDRYRVLDILDHSELPQFIRLYLKKKNLYSRLYLCFNLLSFAALALYSWYLYTYRSFEIGNLFTYFSYGLALTVLLLPVHEYIHLLAYKRVGAAHTSFKSNFRRLYFMALADQFVTDRREFTLVAIAPFAIISSALLIALFFVNAQTQITILGIHLAHTALCSGDFGLMSYFEHHKAKEPVTYDAIAENKTYFLERI